MKNAYAAVPSAVAFSSLVGSLLLLIAHASAAGIVPGPKIVKPPDIVKQPEIVKQPSIGGSKDKTRTIDGWGEFIDPAGDCTVAQEKGVVVITVPGTSHNLNPTREYDNVLAPRILQRVDGDFLIQVKVPAFPMPKAKSAAGKDGHSYVAAGLLIWQGPKTFIRCLRAAHGDRGEVFVHIESFLDGQHYYQGFKAGVDRRSKDQDIFLKIERKEDTLTLSRSTDGGAWQTAARATRLKLPKEVQVGVAAVNSTNQEFAPRFEGLVVKGK